MKTGSVVILGVFVADTAYRAERQPRMGETILGTSFKLGPGGKGSNQAVAAGKLGVETHFITRLGVDDFANMATKAWADAGVTSAAIVTPDSYTERRISSSKRSPATTPSSLLPEQRH